MKEICIGMFVHLLYFMVKKPKNMVIKGWTMIIVWVMMCYGCGYILIDWLPRLIHPTCGG